MFFFCNFPSEIDCIYSFFAGVGAKSLDLHCENFKGIQGTVTWRKDPKTSMWLITMASNIKSPIPGVVGPLPFNPKHDVFHSKFSDLRSSKNLP